MSYWLSIMVPKCWMGSYMKMKVIGRTKLKNQLKEMGADLRSDLTKQMKTTMSQMDRDVKIGINTGARSGRVYRRGGRTGQRSAPGELPKTDTGDLVSKFSTNVRSTKRKIVGVLSNSSDHAVQLEFDLASKGGRPFMRPLWEKWRPLLTVKFVTVIRRSLRSNSR